MTGRRTIQDAMAEAILKEIVRFPDKFPDDLVEHAAAYAAHKVEISHSYALEYLYHVSFVSAIERHAKRLPDLYARKD